MYRMRLFFGGRKDFKYFFGMLDIPDNFFLAGGGGVNGRCWAHAYG